MKWLRNIIQRWHTPHLHVWLDSRDNSVTLSKALWRHMCAGNRGSTKPAEVFVFYSKQDCAYGFIIDHGITNPTQLCAIQYNDRHRCIGFETLCPSVGKIFYRYGLPADCVKRLNITVATTGDGKTYYIINRP